MFVFIAHAEADQAAADDLKAFLKTRGLIAETETGARGFRHLGASDIAIVLWSQKSPFATHRMQIERRMLDAWADQQLVLVKLDHGFLPVGVRDLPAIDASFEQSRQLTAWPQVAQAARDAIKRLQAASSRVEGVGSGWTDDGGLRERARDLGPLRDSGSVEFSASQATTPEPKLKYSRRPAPSVAKASVVATGDNSENAKPSAGAFWSTIAIGLLPVTGIAIFGLFLLQRVGKGHPPLQQFPIPEPVALGAAGVAVFFLVLLFILSSRGRGKASKRSPSVSKSARTSSAPPPGPAAAPAPVAQPAPPPGAPAAALLFVSYAHADDAAVSPIVQMVEGAGRHVWIDKTGIQTGDGWAGEIVRAIKAAKGVIVMCSKHAFESDHIKREVYLADRYKKPMVPLFIEEAAPPEDFEYFFASVQWLELFKLPEADRAEAVGQALKAV